MLIGVAAVAVVVSAGLYALFHGYFDHGQFEVLRVQWASSHQVAMVARRLDHEALGGLEFFVLVGSHLYTPSELRHAYYSDAVVFSTSNDCLAVHWDAPNRLTITCDGLALGRDDINVERRQVGSVAISYQNIGPR
jgi:hypothetical protein